MPFFCSVQFKIEFLYPPQTDELATVEAQEFGYRYDISFLLRHSYLALLNTAHTIVCSVAGSANSRCHAQSVNRPRRQPLKLLLHKRLGDAGRSRSHDVFRRRDSSSLYSSTSYRRSLLPAHDQPSQVLRRILPPKFHIVLTFSSLQPLRSWWPPEYPPCPASPPRFYHRNSQGTIGG